MDRRESKLVATKAIEENLKSAGIECSAVFSTDPELEDDEVAILEPRKDGAMLHVQVDLLCTGTRPYYVVEISADAKEMRSTAPMNLTEAALAVKRWIKHGHF